MLYSLAPLASAEENTDRCHCFRNRSYDPADRYVSDDYLLTTTTNSLLANQFKISKRLIVMIKMKGGVSNTDLLIGLHLAAAGDTDVGHILVLKGEKTWHDALQSVPELTRLGESDHLARQMRDGLSDADAGRKIMAGLLSQKFSVAAETIEKLAEQALSAKEMVLVLTLADYSGTDPAMIVRLKKNGLSWSEIAHNFGLTPAEVGKLLLPGQEN